MSLVRHKQDWGREFILLLPRATELPVSDAGSVVVQAASNFVIQNRQTSCSGGSHEWDVLLEGGWRFVWRRRTHNSMKEREPICYDHRLILCAKANFRN